VSSAVTIPVIASGGAGSADDFAPAILDGGASAVLAASIFHFGEVTLAEARTALAEAGAPVRMV
jgi:imidazole glycerol-phosphate synthase subunit HisF